MGQSEHPRPRDPEAACRALLDAARVIFARDGFDGARVDDIAEAAGYNKALIFRYFGDKVGLYREVVAHTKQLVYNEIAQPMLAIAREPTALDAERVQRFIEEAVRCSFDFYSAHPHCMCMMRWEAAESWRTYTITHPPGEEGNWMQEICDFMAQAQAAGLLRRDVDPILLVANTISLTFGYHSAIPRYQTLFPAIDLLSTEALAHAREQIARLILHGILTHPEEEHDAARL